MIVVRVELWSAVTGTKTELARMHICNDETGNAIRRNYVGTSFIGRDAAALDRGTPSKTGQVTNWPAAQLHIWNLVHRMLGAMGYTKS